MLLPIQNNRYEVEIPSSACAVLGVLENTLLFSVFAVERCPLSTVWVSLEQLWLRARDS